MENKNKIDSNERKSKKVPYLIFDEILKVQSYGVKDTSYVLYCVLDFIFDGGGEYLIKWIESDLIENIKLLVDMINNWYEYKTNYYTEDEMELYAIAIQSYSGADKEIDGMNEICCVSIRDDGKFSTWYLENRIDCISFMTLNECKFYAEKFGFCLSENNLHKFHLVKEGELRKLVYGNNE